MVEIGKSYKSRNGHTATVNALYGDRVFYSDEYGCRFHKSLSLFIEIYAMSVEQV